MVGYAYSITSEVPVRVWGASGFLKQLPRRASRVTVHHAFRHKNALGGFWEVDALGELRHLRVSSALLHEHKKCGKK